MNKVYIAIFVCLLATGTNAQWSDKNNQFYDSLAMPVSVEARSQGNSIVLRSYPDSGYIVIWEDSRPISNNIDIYAQKYDKEGNVLWAVNGIPVATGPDNQQFNPPQNTDARYYSHACTDSSGGFYVTWQDNNTVNTGVTNKIRVCVQHVRNDGSSVFANTGFVAAEGSSSDSYQYLAPQLIADGNRGFFLGFIRNGFASNDVYTMCYRDEGGIMKSYGGRKMDPDNSQGTDISSCGVRKYFNFVEDNVKNFFIYPDLQGGCGIVWTFERNAAQPLRGPHVAYNKLCRVKKDSRATVRRRVSDLASTSIIERVYKKDSVVGLYDFHAFFYSQVCLPYVVPNQVIENGGEGFLLLDTYSDANPLYDLYYPKGTMVTTGGNVNANVFAVVRRKYINSALTAFHTYGYGLPDEIYDSIPYQLQSDSINGYWAYNITPPAGLDTVETVRDTLLASSIYYYDFQLTGGGDRALLTAKVLSPAYTNSGTVLIQELKSRLVSANKYKVEINTASKEGITIGRELSTGFQTANITYDQPAISMDQTGNALFYISEYGRYIRASPVDNGAKLVWGAMGRALGNVYGPERPFTAMGEDGTAVIAWNDSRPTVPNTTGQNVYMRHLDNLDVYDYTPPVKKLLALSNFATTLPPYILNGLTAQWSLFEAYTGAGTGWTPVTSIVDNYNFGTVQTQVYRHNLLTPIRTTAGNPYLDRNYTIIPERDLTGGATTMVRLYFTQAEFDRIKAADPTILTPENLGVIKQPHTSGVPPVYTPVAADEFITPVSWGEVAGGYYVEISVNGFSNFFINKAAGVLPVKWLNVDAQWVVAGQAKVSWLVAEQQDVKNYIVQHSMDGSIFKDVCTVNASGNTAYSCMVNPGAGGRHYYRVLQYDHDGRSSYSKTVFLDAFTQQNTITVVPNPSSGPATLRYNSSTVTIESLILYNGNGMEVWRLRGRPASGNAVNIPLQTLGSGLYMLHVNSNEGMKVFKIIKQ